MHAIRQCTNCLWRVLFANHEMQHQLFHDTKMYVFTLQQHECFKHWIWFAFVFVYVPRQLCKYMSGVQMNVWNVDTICLKTIFRVQRFCRWILLLSIYQLKNASKTISSVEYIITDLCNMYFHSPSNVFENDGLPCPNLYLLKHYLWGRKKRKKLRAREVAREVARGFTAI